MSIDRITIATLGCVLGGAALLAALNLFAPAASAAHVPDFAISLTGKYLCYAILALAVDLVWGYVGILTLGHAAFFALGGYAMGMYLMREIGARGVYANPTLPDFMIFIGWNKLPWYWYGFDHFWFALIMVLLVPGVLAGVFGWFAFRSRVSGVYLSIITQALTYALLLAFFRNDMGFGGNNGMTDFKDILGFPLNRESTSVGLMLITADRAVGGVPAGARDYRLAVRQGAGGGARCGGAHPLSRLPARIVQARGLGGLGGDRRDRRCALRAAGRHHQPLGIRPRQFDRGGDLGRGRRARHARWSDPRRGHGQSRQDLVDQRLAGNLAVCVRRVVHLGDIVPAARNHRSVRGALGRRRDGRAQIGCCRVGGARGHGVTEGTLLYLDGVSVSFDGFKALNELSLVLEPGEMRAVIGPNGAGKTTMMDVITGKTKPDAGRVVFGDDTDLTRLDEPAIARLGIGRKFQRPTVFEPLSVRDNVLLALDGDRSPRFALWARETPDERARIEEILLTIRLGAERDRRAADLSHGQKQWLEIGMLLAQDPRLLLVDEPVAGMTDAETAATADLLREINRTRSVVVVEHDMAFVRALGVKVTVLHEGAVLAEGSIDAIQDNPRVIEVYLGR